MNKDETFKLPRLFTKQPLSSKGVIELENGQAHYLHTVLRRQNGDYVRLFNGKDGEWLGNLNMLGKKSGDVILAEQLVEQPDQNRRLHLLFAPIKKHRMDWLVEKAVELGVTDFHPILTQNTEVRKINTKRLTQQIFESAEQCERFEIPILHPLEKMEKTLSKWSPDIPLMACLERYEAKPLQDITNIATSNAFLIGPEGGFTREEKDFIAQNAVAVSLGETILRSETAVIKALVILNP